MYWRALSGTGEVCEGLSNSHFTRERCCEHSTNGLVMSKPRVGEARESQRGQRIGNRRCRMSANPKKFGDSCSERFEMLNHISVRCLS